MRKNGVGYLSCSRFAMAAKVMVMAVTMVSLKTSVIR